MRAEEQTASPDVQTSCGRYIARRIDPSTLAVARSDEVLEPGQGIPEESLGDRRRGVASR